MARRNHGSIRVMRAAVVSDKKSSCTALLDTNNPNRPNPRAAEAFLMATTLTTKTQLV
jgi:hypothetical protein